MYERLFGDRDPVAEPGTATGTPGDWWTVFANSPDVIEHAGRGFAPLRQPRPQDRPASCASSARPGPVGSSAASSCSPSTASRAGRYGFSEEKIEALKAWRVSDLFSPIERALLAYTDALVLGFGRGRRRRVRRHAGAPRRRGDPRVHLHHDDVHDARRHLAWRCASSTTTATTRSSRSPRPADYKPANLGRQIGYGIDEVDADGASVERDASTGPLAGVRVLELGSFIAGPFAGQLLGDYGADVIKIEPPGDGDPMRRWGVTRDGDSLWWPAIGRNKRSVVLDLRQEAARALVARLAAECDVVLENFRPGRLDDWGLGYAALVGRQPPAGHGPHQRLRPDRTARRPGRLRQRRRGDGRHPPHHRQPRPPAGSRRHQPRRRAGLGLRRHRHAVGARVGPGHRRRPGGRRRHLRGRGRPDGVDDGRLRARRRRAHPRRAACCRAWRRRTSTRRPTAPRSSWPPTPTACSSGCARRWAGPSWPPTTASRPTAAAASTWPSSTSSSAPGRRPCRATRCWRSSTRHGVPAGRIFTAPDMLADPQYLARQMVAAGDVGPGLGRADDRRGAPVHGDARRASAIPVPGSASTPTRC